jgi:hypothetical protein
MKNGKIMPLKWIGTLIVILLVSSAWSQECDKEIKNRSNKTTAADAQLLDVNNIACYISNDGGFGEHPSTGGDGCYFPAGQTDLSLIYTAGLWVIGKVNGEVRSAVNCYGSEFQPGQILSPGVPDNPLDPKYKIYKYNKGDVIDTEAIDQGCPDSVLGDQMLFCVYNDLRDHAGMWGSQPIGLEVQQTAFAFNRQGALGNTIFIRYRIINKGDSPLVSAYTAIFFDPDVGGANDDYVGCDPNPGTGYAFNGDGYDEKYGVQIPALGCDFFQGPVVPSSGEDAVLPDGTVIPHSKILGMTAYFAYICGAPIAGMNDAHTPKEGYYFCQGLLGNGDEWLDPTTGYAPTTFPFSGDPVAGTGWLMSSVTSSCDVKMGLSSGPFNLKVGEYQDIIIGLVVGQGSNNLNSITVMRFYDQVVQMAYDDNFIVTPPPPEPVLTVSQMDESLMLMWDDAAVDFSQNGYEFEGFNVWQGESETGPWTRLATYDKVNAVTGIRDIVYNPLVGELIEQTVQHGSDSGLFYHFHVETNYCTGDSLINGWPYYFAVSAYSYREDGRPKTMESAKQVVTAVPQNPVLDVSFNASVGDTIPVVHNGISQGQVIVQVMDPAGLTGDDYEVTFFIEEDENSDHYEETGWRLTNMSTNSVLLDDQFDQSGMENKIVEGLLVQAFSPDEGILAFIEVANPTYPEPMPDEQLDNAGRPYGGNNVWWSLSCPDDINQNGRYFWSHQSTYIGDLSACHDYEIRWKDGVTNYSWAEWGFENGSFNKVPFELWDIGIATPYDATDDERMIPVCYAAGYTVGVWDVPNGAAVEDHWGYGCSDRVFFYYPDPPYTYADFHAAAEAGNFSAANGMWGVVYPLGNRPLIRLVVVNYDHEYTGPGPAAGTVDRVLTNKPNSPLDVFTFSTADYAPTKSADIAKERLNQIQVFPNPYFCFNSLEPYYEGQFVTFTNLPEECTIRVFSLSGVLVRTLEHDNGTPFERWDLENASKKRVASGMYIVHVNTEFGDRILKLAVINRSL